MRPGKTLSGFVSAEVISADIPGFLAWISQSGIQVYNVRENGELSVRFSLDSQDIPRMQIICDKRGDKLNLCKSLGIGPQIQKIGKRPVLLLGVILLFLLTVYVPSRVFFILVEGNSAVPTRMILEAARESGIRFGTSRRAVRSEKVKNALLESIPKLQWAGVNTFGCVARISVRERTRDEQPLTESAPGNIVARRDGIVTGCTATRGSLLCVPGQAVTQGQILISGYTDCGISIRAEQAQGEVYAQTIHFISAVTPLEVLKKESGGRQMKKYTLLVGKKPINLWKDSGIWDTICDRMYEEYYVTLPGGFRLPLCLRVDTFRVLSLEPEEISGEMAGICLGGLAADYLTGQMNAGQILHENVTVREETFCVSLTGEYVCTEMIGKMQRLEIGEYYGEDN